MDTGLLLGFLGAIFGPLGGIATGIILDRRSKKNTEQTTVVAAKDAATHAFEAITTGYTEYTTKLESRANRADQLEKRVEALEKVLKNLIVYVEALEPHVAPENRPVRPDLSFDR